MKKSNFLKHILIGVGLLCLVGCSNTNAQSTKNKTVKTNIYKTNSVGNSDRQKIMNQYAKWKGVKYKYGGTTKKGVDCSAFIGHVYRDAYNLNLPRTTTYLKTKGKYVPKSQLKHGDMVFFRNNKHVGIYIGDNKFIHASSKKGVITSDLNNGYYKKAYTQARRIL